jgi:hypothetical protein
MKLNNLIPFWRPSQDDTSVFWILFENYLFLLFFLIFWLQLHLVFLLSINTL